MNKTFKIIWNEAVHAYVVTSELARNHCRGKRRSLAKLAACAVTLGVFAGGVGITAHAANEVTGTNAKAFGGGTIDFKKEEYGRTYEASLEGATKATGLNSTAFGYNTLASGQGALAFGGIGAQIVREDPEDKLSNKVLVLYDPNEASGDNAVAFGLNTKATANQATVFGLSNIASGENATAWGNENSATAENATAWGNENSATAENATAWGNWNTAEGKKSTAWGDGNTTEGENATAWGYSNTASGKNATSWGERNIAVGINATAWGAESVAYGQNATAFGEYTRAYGRASTSWGEEDTEAIGDYSTAWGEVTKAYGENSTTWGGYSKAYGKNATAFGYYSEAYGNNSLAILGAKTGFGERTDDKDKYGNWIYTVTGGENAMAVGENAHAKLDDSIALGSRAVADREKGVVGYDLTGEDHSEDASGVWVSTENAVSVGDADNGVTRQITGVAAGTNDTDAVNVAQLKKVAEKIDQAGNDTHIEAGDYAVTDNKVSMNIIDKDGTTTGTVTITDIASKTELDKIDNRVTNIENKIGDITETAGKHSSVSTEDSNVIIDDTGTNEAGGKDYKISLNKDQVLNSVTTGNTVMNTEGLKVGDTVSVTNTAVTAGNTSISNEGLKVDNKIYVSKDGLNANSQKIINVADGEVSATSKDAVNGSQLHATNQQVMNNVNNINRLGDRLDKVGAGAAALAALHPMDFDPDDKWSFAAGYGNYAGQSAAALGAYYRPNEKIMFSVGGTVGNGENMVNAGISFSLDRTNHVSNSRTAMAREILDLRAEVAELKALVLSGGLGSIDEDKIKLFPDVPENHWAYEYIAKLAGNGIIEGYPDGSFAGDRMMSRYEFAALLYRAMQKGAQIDSKIINEFAPEMGRIRVDRISGKDGDRHKIERVRVNYGDKNDKRDHYGSQISGK